MANYIDKDKLIRDLIDNRSFYPAIVKNAIENAPVITINEDYAIQCTCYALGCQMAEKIEEKVAKQIFEEIEKSFIHNNIECFQNCKGTWNYNLKENILTNLAELKKKYIGG